MCQRLKSDIHTKLRSEVEASFERVGDTAAGHGANQTKQKLVLGYRSILQCTLNSMAFLGLSLFRLRLVGRTSMLLYLFTCIAIMASIAATEARLGS